MNYVIYEQDKQRYHGRKGVKDTDCYNFTSDLSRAQLFSRMSDAEYTIRELLKSYYMRLEWLNGRFVNDVNLRKQFEEYPNPPNMVLMEVEITPTIVAQQYEYSYSNNSINLKRV